MRISLGGVAALLVTAAVGCGGGGDATEVALTKAQFIKRGDAICRSAQKKKTEAVTAWSQETANKGKTLADWTHEELGQIYLATALPPEKKAIEELAALVAPTGDAKAEKVVSSLASAVEAIEENPTQIATEAPYADADKLARVYGFKACGLF